MAKPRKDTRYCLVDKYPHTIQNNNKSKTDFNDIMTGDAAAAHMHHGVAR